MMIRSVFVLSLLAVASGFSFQCEDEYAAVDACEDKEENFSLCKGDDPLQFSFITVCRPDFDFRKRSLGKYSPLDMYHCSSFWFLSDKTLLLLLKGSEYVLGAVLDPGANK